MNAPYLESSETLDRFFLVSLHKIIFHIFRNISKSSIHRLRPFKYKNTCELCDKIIYKDKKGRIMVKKCFALHKEVIDVFLEKKIESHYITIQFNLARVRILDSIECGKTINYCFRENASKSIYKDKDILCRNIYRNKRNRNIKSKLGRK